MNGHYRIMMERGGHIGHVDKTSASGYRGHWLKSSSVSFSSTKTPSALFQSNTDYKTRRFDE